MQITINIDNTNVAMVCSTPIMPQAIMKITTNGSDTNVIPITLFIFI